MEARKVTLCLSLGQARSLLGIVGGQLAERAEALREKAHSEYRVGYGKADDAPASQFREALLDLLRSDLVGLYRHLVGLESLVSIEDAGEPAGAVDPDPN